MPTLRSALRRSPVALALALGLALALPARAALHQAYRGDDGSTLHLRVVNGELFGYAEHPQQGYAFVLGGRVQGDRIDARFWDVPRQARHASGAVRLRVQQSGARLELDGADATNGSRSWQALTSVPALATTRRAAAFQSTRRDDLDGAFVGDDGSSHHWRQLQSEVAGVAVKPAQSGKRGWVTVFVGTRSGDGFSGRFADIPGGGGTAKGTFGMQMRDGERDLVVETSGATRMRSLRAEYTVDLDAFAQRIVDGFKGKVVGFGYAIAKDGVVVRGGAAGVRRRPPDGSELPFTAQTQNEAASTTKLVTAAIALRLIAKRGLSPDTAIAAYVPTCWKRGPGIAVGGLTFRQLLQHRSGITRPAACSDNPYECLRQTIETGQVASTDYDYQNINYTLFRYLIPMLDNRTGTNQVFLKRRCDHSKGEEINAEVSERYRRIVIDDVLAPLGIEAGFEPSAPQWANRYDFSRPGEPGIVPSGHDLLEAGSGGMKWSAQAYAEFLGALDTGRIVAPALVRSMRTDLMGFDRRASGDPGGYPMKNGGAGGTQSMAMVFPSGIGIYVTINSDHNDYGPRSLGEVLRDAFDASVVTP